MPIIDGFEASRIIRQNLKNDAIPIIAVTGNAMESDIQKIGDAGMNGHIAKPIDIKTFYTTLYYALDKSLSHVKKNQTLLEVA
jgi:CheY-like chemotaxis protein